MGESSRVLFHERRISETVIEFKAIDEYTGFLTHLIRFLTILILLFIIWSLLSNDIDVSSCVIVLIYFRLKVNLYFRL